MFDRLPRPFLSSLGARLGILAIVLQLVFSFAHIHPLPAFEPVAAAPAHSGTSESGPAATGDCAICAVIAAFSILALPEAIGLGTNGFWVVFRPAAPALWSPPQTEYRLFHTRAPPSART